MPDEIYVITATVEDWNGSIHRVLCFATDEARAKGVVTKLEREQVQLATWLEDDYAANRPECADPRRAPRSWWTKRDARLVLQLRSMIYPPMREQIGMSDLNRTRFKIERAGKTVVARTIDDKIA